MALGRFVEGRGNHLGIHRAGHVGNLFRALVDEQHDEVGLRMVGGDGVGNVLHQHGLTGLRLGHEQGTLSLTDWGKQVYDTGRERIVVSLAQLELLVREEGGEVFERHTVAHFARLSSVDLGHADEREIFFSFLRRAYRTLYHVTGLQTEELDL